MIEQSSSESRDDDLSGSKRPGRCYWKWFPLLWSAILAAPAAWVQWTDVTRDYKIMAMQGAGIAILVGLSIWFAVATPYSRRLRWGAFLGLWAALFAVYYNIDIINDGDNRWVGVRWRFAPKPDELLDVPTGAAAANDWQPSARDYPRFLGGGYWAEVDAVQLASDWQTNPPEEIWRREIGAGWSSFSVVGNYAVTQEQRGEYEMVTCYALATGDVVWTRKDPVRFDPDDVAGGLGGTGPRATPTIHDDRIYTMGATGLLRCLDARTGDVVWADDAVANAGADPLVWGMSGSPLVVDDMLIVNVGAPRDASLQESHNSSLVAYDRHNGEVVWRAGNRVTAYASPVLAELGGVLQILQVNQDYVTSHRLTDGQVLWEYDWPGSSSGDASCSQPVPLPGDRVFLSKGYATGSSLIRVSSSEGQWQAEPLWTPPYQPVMRTKFANVVIRDGFVYGIDGTMLQCIELETGAKQWKKRRRPPFGHGQVMLIGDVLLVISEIGELALVECTPEEYRELASLQVFDPGDVTWNNPAFSSSYLLLRNAREAVCLRLPLAEPSVDATVNLVQ